MISRRRLLWTALAAGGTLFADAAIVEPRWLDVTRTRVRSGKLRGRVRILQLSDLHMSWTISASQIRTAIELGLVENPDLVCLTGDFVTTGGDVNRREYVEVLKILSEELPVYGILGNHEILK